MYLQIPNKENYANAHYFGCIIVQMEMSYKWLLTAGATVMKNWDPFVLGPALAILSV